MKNRLFRRKEILLPTLYGWLLIIVLCGLVVLLLAKRVHPWLAQNNPLDAKVLIVEGWLPDYALQEAFQLFSENNYQHIITTGGPLGTGYYLSEYKSFANLSAQTLIEIGMDSRNITPLAADSVDKDRTYTSSLEVKKWLADNPQTNKLNLVTLGTHARRSYYSFRDGLPAEIELGVISIEDKGYESQRWWAYSQGIRSVIYEGLAYFYVLLF